MGNPACVLRASRMPNLLMWSQTRCHCAMVDHALEQASQAHLSVCPFWFRHRHPPEHSESTYGSRQGFSSRMLHKFALQRETSQNTQTLALDTVELCLLFRYGGTKVVGQKLWNPKADSFVCGELDSVACPRSCKAGITPESAVRGALACWLAWPGWLDIVELERES